MHFVVFDKALIVAGMGRRGLFGDGRLTLADLPGQGGQGGQRGLAVLGEGKSLLCTLTLHSSHFVLLWIYFGLPFLRGKLCRWIFIGEWEIGQHGHPLSPPQQNCLPFDFLLYAPATDFLLLPLHFPLHFIIIE